MNKHTPAPLYYHKTDGGVTIKADNATAKFKCIDGEEFPPIREELIA